ncbi:MAG TPA: AbrB/MazE/SpoVT family DNA-binding domain-containing protein [Allosphingosinicella sp.]|jgi:antitoxin PrlF|nr:AbrB/MazE/SpoVT family DNA-binding domain-containing protein [Allosphingosinicella sp.]
MIESRVTSKAQVTLPKAVRAALGLQAGDVVAWEIADDCVVLMRADGDDALINNFAMFDEWASEADCAAFDNL